MAYIYLTDPIKASKGFPTFYIDEINKYKKRIADANAGIFPNEPTAEEYQQHIDEINAKEPNSWITGKIQDFDVPNTEEAFKPMISTSECFEKAITASKTSRSNLKGLSDQYWLNCRTNLLAEKDWCAPITDALRKNAEENKKFTENRIAMRQSDFVMDYWSAKISYLEAHKAFLEYIIDQKEYIYLPDTEYAKWQNNPDSDASIASKEAEVKALDDKQKALYDSVVPTYKQAITDLKNEQIAATTPNSKIISELIPQCKDDFRKAVQACWDSAYHADTTYLAVKEEYDKCAGTATPVVTPTTSIEDAQKAAADIKTEVAEVQKTVVEAQKVGAELGKTAGQVINGTIQTVNAANDLLNGKLPSASKINSILKKFKNFEDIQLQLMGNILPPSHWYPVGTSQVIKMQYHLALGLLANDTPDLSLTLACTESYYMGVSLSEIRWGFLNVASGDPAEKAKINFTLHDIAGEGFNNFLRAKDPAYCLFFKGPTNTGGFWPTDRWVKYQLVGSECNLEFSATQGFTYSYSGNAIAELPRNTRTVLPEDIQITGHFTESGENSKITSMSNTFKDYMTEFIIKWNSRMKETKPEAMIALDDTSEEFGTLHDYGEHPHFWDRTPYITAKERGIEKGDKQTRIQPVMISKGTTLYDAIAQIWRNFKLEGEEDQPAPKVLFKNVNKSHQLVFSLHLLEDINNVVDEQEKYMLPVCIGSDANCVNRPFRGQLVGLDFGNLLGVLVSNTHNVDPKIPVESTASVIANGETQVQDTTPKKSTAGDTGVDNNGVRENSKPDQSITPQTKPIEPVFSGWMHFKDLLNAKGSNFTVEVEMPYSYGFHPESLGGLLKDIHPEDKSANGIFHIEQGVDLEFYWYKDTNCEVLEKNEIISQKFRLTKVGHTLGLSGHSTHLTLKYLKAN